MTGKIEIDEKTCQNAENKQTFGLTGKNEIDEKTCQNAENKQTSFRPFVIFTWFTVFFYLESLTWSKKL